MDLEIRRKPLLARQRPPLARGTNQIGADDFAEHGSYVGRFSWRNYPIDVSVVDGKVAFDFEQLCSAIGVAREHGAEAAQYARILDCLPDEVRDFFRALEGFTPATTSESLQ